MWANGGGQGDMRFNIYAPDGSSVLASNPGQNSGISSVDIVKFPCNSGPAGGPAAGPAGGPAAGPAGGPAGSSAGVQFPAWGKET
jgi:hypothetical protein